MILNRRLFLGVGFLTIGVLLLRDKKIIAVVSPIKTITVLQSDLFPDLSQPSSIKYLQNVILNHTKISQKDKEFIRNGASWLNEKSINMFDKPYTKLPQIKRQKVLKQISKTTWGDNWLYAMMGYMFEAMLGDPIYGINEDKKGWKWLDFKGAKPRVKKAYL